MKELLQTFGTILACASTPLAAQQNTDMHDPVVVRGEDGKYYMFATGMGIPVKSSDNLTDWQREKPPLLQPRRLDNFTLRNLSVKPREYEKNSYLCGLICLNIDEWTFFMVRN